MTTNKTIEERIVKLEVLVERYDQILMGLESTIKEHFSKEIEDREKLMSALATIEQARSGDKRFIGGIVFAVSSLWALIVAGLEFLKVYSK